MLYQRVDLSVRRLTPSADHRATAHCHGRNSRDLPEFETEVMRDNSSITYLREKKKGISSKLFAIIRDGFEI